MDPVQTASDGFSQLEFARGVGQYCWTTDGRKFLDLVCGQGPVILGHAHPAVTAAVARQMGNGLLLPGPGPQLRHLTELLISLYPHYSRLLPFKTGSEAVAASIRIARAHTGRHRILRVGFLGWHDELVSPYLRCHSYEEKGFQVSWPVGVPHSAYSGLTHTWTGENAYQLLEVVESFGDQLAAILLDPVQLRPPLDQEVARRLSEFAQGTGALLILDESKTGFRVHLGGAQRLYGVHPDLTVLSKALANGFPLAVVLGNDALLQTADSARIKGTFRYELASITAAIATTQELQRVDAPTHLVATGEKLLAGLNETFDSVGLREHVRAVPYHWPCMPFIQFAPEAQNLVNDYYSGMLTQGVLLMKSHMNYISLALTEIDVATVINASVKVLRRICQSADLVDVSAS
jgi:glutamate-1-semialdehyde 2,1-aminomutase